MSATAWTWIYKPRSGDRVFAQREHPELAVHTWEDGCRHVAGGVLLSVVAAEAGAWWRDDATALAKAIVAVAGGLAWDEQGTITLIVPASAALQAARLLARGEALHARGNGLLGEANLVRLVTAGARLTSSLRDVEDGPPPGPCLTLRREDADGVAELVALGEDGQELGRQRRRDLALAPDHEHLEHHLEALRRAAAEAITELRLKRGEA